MALAWLCQCFTHKQNENACSSKLKNKAMCRNPEVIVEIQESASDVLEGILQKALCHASQEKLVERRAKALVDNLCYHLGTTSSLVRLYGLSEDGTDKLAFVLLASTASIEEDPPGKYVAFPAASKDAGMPAHKKMLYAAFATKAVVTHICPDTSAVFVALPLLLGEAMTSVLWIQQQPNQATVNSLLRSPIAQQQLMLSASIILAAGLPDAPNYLGGLSMALRRLADCMTLKTLVAELRGILSAHVRRHFLLEASIKAAVVPVAGSQLAFLLEEDQSVRAACGGAGGGGSLATATGNPTQGQVALAAEALLAGSSYGTHGGVIAGGDSEYGNGDRAAVSGSNLTYSGPHALAASKLDAFASRGGTARRGSCHEGHATSLLGHAAISPAGGGVRTAAQGIRRSSSEMNLTKAATRAASVQPLRRPTGQAGALLADIPLNSSRGRASRCVMANGGSQGGRMLMPQVGLMAANYTSSEAGAVWGAFNTVVALVALRAKPFRLSETVLQQMMLQSTSEERGGADGGEISGSDRFHRNGVLMGEVVPDCLLYVQSIRRPSRDVYMLINAAAGGGGVKETAATMAALYDSSGMCGSTSSSVRTRLPSPGLAVMPGGGSTGGVVVSGGGGGGGCSSPPAVMKSLTLLGVTTGEGEVLGLYVSFPFTLPHYMLEAIRNSCADLLHVVLAPLIRQKLRDQCASELETLACGVPGNYVIVPSGKAPTVPPTFARCQPNTLGIRTSDSGGMTTAVGPGSPTSGPTHVTGGNGVAVITGGPQTQAAPATPRVPDGDRASTGRVVSEPLDDLVEPTLSVNQAGARTVGLLSPLGVWTTEGRPAPAASGFRTAHRNSNRPSPARTLSSKQRMLCLWEGTGETSSQGVVSGGNGATHTGNGMSQGTGGASVLGTAASASLAASGISFLRRDTAQTEVLQGPMEMLSNDAALLTLLEADCDGSARAQLGVLVESIMSTLRDSSIQPGVEDLYDYTSPQCRALREMLRPLADDLDELCLTTMVGTGASGVVLMGKLATVPVAVKLMELPAGAFSEGGGHTTKSDGGKEGRGDGDGGGNNPPTQPQTDRQKARVEARRTLLRSATELAVLRSVSHINIVQVYAVYNNVCLNRVSTKHGDVSYKLSYRRHGETQNVHGPEECPPCVAVCMELADCGSLESALAQRIFPRWYHHRRPGVPQAELMMSLDLEGVYLTLLEIALALRHLHSRRLVHRDLKPANILLKSNPSDPRGWNCKLADFGFALVLDHSPQLTEDGSAVLKPYTVQEQACGTVTHMAPETLRAGARIDASVDMFALGVIMWEMVAGRGYRPYKQMEQAEIPPAVLEGMRPIFPDGLVPAQYRKMAQSCWSTEPNKRPSAADVVTFAKEQLQQLNGQSSRRRGAYNAR